MKPETAALIALGLVTASGLLALTVAYYDRRLK